MEKRHQLDREYHSLLELQTCSNRTMHLVFEIRKILDEAGFPPSDADLKKAQDVAAKVHEEYAKRIESDKILRTPSTFK